MITQEANNGMAAHGHKWRSGPEAQAAGRKGGLATAARAQARKAAVAKPDPRTCDHEFLDTPVCLKCGWRP